MKKMFLLGSMLALVGGIASASSINSYCLPNTGNNFAYTAPGQSSSVDANSPTVLTCGALGTLPALSTVNSIEIFYIADYSGGLASGGNTINTTFVVSDANFGAHGGTSVVEPYTCVTMGFGTSGAGPCTYQTLQSPGTAYSEDVTDQTALSLTGFTVSITAQEVGTSYVQDSTFEAIVEYDYTLPAPEPSSLIMIGSGLLGIGFMVRRRKKA